jgi:predicted ATP-binding protein involved in virulence
MTMKEIKLVNLSCKNFMGFLDFNHSFDGKSTDILGDNGTGKQDLEKYNQLKGEIII